MSATGRATDGREDLTDEERSAAAHRYFRAIEDLFIRLRGSPLLLSPADHLVARKWFEQRVPMEVVARALEGVFARRRERGASGKVSSLRYCRPAVEKEWKRVAQLQAADVRAQAPDPAEPEIELAARLAVLCAQLPEQLQGVELWRQRITALSGEAETVEERLAALDAELIAEVDEALTESAARELDEAVKAALQAIAGRLTSEQLQAAGERLRRQLLRQRLGLPLLTLFDSYKTQA